MELSLTTDYVTGSGDPRPYLKAIGRSGFTHVHWCHEWNTDYLYTPSDISGIAAWLKNFHLSLLDLHASAGQGVNWGSSDEIKRKAGVALVVNRMNMTAVLAGEAIVLHIPSFDGPEPDKWFDRLRLSLDELEKYSRRSGIRIALENVGSDENWSQLEKVFASYPADFAGLCYDAGHGNFNKPSLAKLEALKDRLIAVHLHDNDGSGDQHLVPFCGSVDWDRVIDIIARSSYKKCVSLESSVRKHEGWDEAKFLGEAFMAAEKLEKMLESRRSAV